MQQKWWLVAAGVIGIGLAVLLFPRPDTGSSVAAGERTNEAPLAFKKEDRGATRVNADGKPEFKPIRRDIKAPEQRLGPNPLAAELAARRSTPEAVYAGRASGPWTIVRRQLMLMTDDADAKALAEELSQLVLALRGLRRDPETGSYADLEKQQRDLLAKVRANPAWLEDQVLVASLDRVDGILVEYQQADKTGAEAPATEGQAPAPAGGADDQE